MSDLPTGPMPPTRTPHPPAPPTDAPATASRRSGAACSPRALPLLALMLVGPAAACDRSSGAGTAAADDRSPTSSGEARVIGATEAAEPPPEGLATAIFAGGCFWCMEHPFERLDGVGEVVSGYTGGEVVGPSYRDVAYGRTDHLEAVRVVYDPDRIAYETLVEVFFLNVDPTQSDGQFCDRGEQYRTAIFVDGPEQRAAARKAKEAAAETLDEPIVTPIRDAGPFFVAEDYHQNYYRTHAAQYQRYRRGCGRDARLRALWGDRAGGEGVAN